MVDLKKLYEENIPSVVEMVQDFPVRALQLYGPNEKNIDAFETFIEDIVAPAGITHLSIMLYYHFDYPSHPEIVEPPFTSIPVARRVAKVCQKYGITVIPEIDIPSHQSQIRKGDVAPLPMGIARAYPEMEEPYSMNTSTRSLCTAHPDLAPIVCDMIDDLMDAFETSTIHVGFDEVQNIAKCPRCKGTPAYKLIADLANRINEHIKARGGEMWMWGDRLLDGKLFPCKDIMYETSIHGTAPAIDLISKDIVICDWHYNYERMGHTTPGYYEMKGFRHLSCCFNSIMGTEQFTHATHVLKESPRTLGMYLTSWANLDAFMRLVREKIDEYRRTGELVQNAPETADIGNAGNFADLSSNIFLYMFVKPDNK